ncbi:hypothetical protein [Streptomyces sp. AK08-02]|uniref:hypothetical protein n=1 Tax=Streptomyces sp. AK08-02 TaxID=3028654 RepID=UPI0029B99DF7|nr:hypothetical protein [Streptomyces sp. AK08-02]MDX3746689.1 hypothetical protein [Streptomyces sp. AK08-02]
MSTPPDPTVPPAAGNPPPPGTGPGAPPSPVPQPPAPDPVPAAGGKPADDPALGPEGEKALTEWKKRAKEAEQREKDQAARLKEFEDRDKTDAEKQAEALKAATERADQATRLAVSSQVEALAAGRFQDPQDAVTALQSGTFVTADGTVDRAAITAALDNLLTQKPHWAPSGPLTPRPDPSQGPRPGGTAGGVEDQIAAAKAKGDWRTVLSLENAKLANVKN